MLVLGLSPRLEGEEMKVPVEGFSGRRPRLARHPARAGRSAWNAWSRSASPPSLVLMNGSAVSVNWARDHVPAIVEAWYPGQAGGTALADVLFGDYNPAGRLPVTFYKSAGQLPPFTDYNMKGRTYRYFKGEPLFPFGYRPELHYVCVPQSARAFAIECRRRNQSDGRSRKHRQSGGRGRGPTLPQAAGASRRAVRSLEGFERVALRPAERKTVTFHLEPRQFSVHRHDGKRTVQPGEFGVNVGAATATIRLNGSPRELN